MRFNHESDPTHYSIRAYGQTHVDIKIPASVAVENNSDQALRLTQSFIMSTQHLIQNWAIRSVAELNSTLFGQIVEIKPEIILLGTGIELIFPDQAITAAALEIGVGVDVMDSSAACRTYNILMLEGRQVVLALIMA